MEGEGVSRKETFILAGWPPIFKSAAAFQHCPVMLAQGHKSRFSKPLPSPIVAGLNAPSFAAAAELLGCYLLLLLLLLLVVAAAAVMRLCS